MRHPNLPQRRVIDLGDHRGRHIRQAQHGRGTQDLAGLVPAQWRNVVVVAGLTGLGVAELAALRVGDVGVKGGRIVIAPPSGPRD